MEQPSARVGERDLRTLLTILWRRKWIVVLPTLAGLAAGIVIGLPFILKPVYRAEATLLVETPQPVGKELQGIVPGASQSDQQQLDRLDAILQSRDFLLKVADQIGMRTEPGWGVAQWVAGKRKDYRGMSDREIEDIRLVQLLKDRARMYRAKNGGNVVVVLGAAAYSADAAYQLARALTDAFIQANLSAQVDRLKSMQSFSEEQLHVYRQRLADAERDLENYQQTVEKNRAKTSLLTDATMTDVRHLRTQASDDLDRLTRERNDLRVSLAGRYPDVAGRLRSVEDATWNSSVQAMEDLERQYAQGTIARGTGQGGETVALIIARRLEDLQNIAADLVARGAWNVPEPVQKDAAALLMAEARVSGASARVAAYDQMISDYDAQVAGTPRRDLIQKALADDVDAIRKLYDAFVNQLASSQISEAFTSANVGTKLSVLEPASRPLKPAKPNRMACALLGMIAGFMLGIGALALVERQDQTFRDPKDAERFLGLHVLGSLPSVDGILLNGRAGRDAVWTPARIDAYLGDSPAYQELRRVVLQLRGRAEAPVRSVLLTSTRAGEGKSTSCILLGVAAAAEEHALPVLLVDLDFRRASLARLLALEGGGPGAAEALETRRLDERMFRSTSLPNLHVLPMGGAPEARNELLTYDNLAWMIPELMERFGLVIIDSPPNLPVPDPLIIGQLVDSVILVVKAGSTPARLVERAVELQRQFTGNVRGLLMNDVAEAMPYHYNYRHYSYGYRSEARR